MQLRLSSSAEASQDVYFNNERHELASLSDVLPTVKGIMEDPVKVPRDKIIMEPIKVIICAPRLHSLEITDLPGITEANPFSKQLIRMFMRDNPDTLVLCLVDANCRSLAAHAGTYLACKYATMPPWLVLTRSDQVPLRPHDLQQQLLKPCLEVSGDAATAQLKKVHLVSAFLHTRPAQSSIQTGENEYNQKNIFENPEVMSAAYEPHRELLQQHFSMGRLISDLVAFDERLMCSQAVPALLGHLKHRLQDAQRRVDDLGPQNVCVQEALEKLVNSCEFQKLIDALLKPAAGDPVICMTQSNGSQLPAAQFRPLEVQSPALAYFQQQSSRSKEFCAGAVQWLASKPWMPLLEAMVKAACCSSGLDRFPGLEAAIVGSGLARAIDADEVTAHICSMPCVRELQLQPPDLTRPDVLPNIEAAMREALIVAFIVPLTLAGGPLARCLDPGLVLEESASHKEKRQRAGMSLCSLREACSSLATILAAYPVSSSAAGPSQVQCLPEGRLTWGLLSFSFRLPDDLSLLGSNIDEHA